jgi:hypothetical protein
MGGNEIRATVSTLQSPFRNPFLLPLQPAVEYERTERQ